MCFWYDYILQTRDGMYIRLLVRYGILFANTMHCRYLVLHVLSFFPLIFHISSSAAILVFLRTYLKVLGGVKLQNPTPRSAKTLSLSSSPPLIHNLLTSPAALAFSATAAVNFCSAGGFAPVKVSALSPFSKMKNAGMLRMPSSNAKSGTSSVSKRAKVYLSLEKASACLLNMGEMALQGPHQVAWAWRAT